MSSRSAATTAEPAPLVRARQLAVEKGIYVVAICRDKQTHEIVGIVTNSYSCPGVNHTVIVGDTSLSCDCFYYQKAGGVCTHRAVAHDRLLMERARRAPQLTTRATIDGKPVRIWR